LTCDFWAEFEEIILAWRYAVYFHLDSIERLERMEKNERGTSRSPSGMTTRKARAKAKAKAKAKAMAMAMAMAELAGLGWKDVFPRGIRSLD
jgi:ferric-dicitrate binding protein FerR (iron transport regulator)